MFVPVYSDNKESQQEKEAEEKLQTLKKQLQREGSLREAVDAREAAVER